MDCHVVGMSRKDNFHLEQYSEIALMKLEGRIMD